MCFAKKSVQFSNLMKTFRKPKIFLSALSSLKLSVVIKLWIIASCILISLWVGLLAFAVALRCVRLEEFVLTPMEINSGWGSETVPFKKLRKIEV